MIDQENNKGIIYILSNPAMPGILKIGLTTHNDVKIRMDELYKTGTPLPFDCEYAAIVSNLNVVEKSLHIAFSDKRINPKREFFKVEVDQVKAIIKLLEIENVTPKILEQEILDKTDLVEREASREYKQKRPVFKFTEIGIEIGSIIYSNVTKDEAKVISDRKVLFRGGELSLTAATHICLGLKEEDNNRRPAPYWTFNGKKLSDMYDNIYLN